MFVCHKSTPFERKTTIEPSSKALEHISMLANFEGMQSPSYATKLFVFCSSEILILLLLPPCLATHRVIPPQI